MILLISAHQERNKEMPTAVMQGHFSHQDIKLLV
jgi:hypothetical protein